MDTKTALIELLSISLCRSKYGTPTFSILCSAFGVIFVSWLSFQEILEFLNFLYSIGMLLELAAFVKLRIKKPDLNRPYRVPLQTFGATMLCLPPTALLVLVMCLASAQTFLISGIIIVVGFLLYPTLLQAKNRRWAKFISVQPAATLSDAEDRLAESQPVQEVSDEAAVRLLSESSPSSIIAQQ